MPDEKIEEQSEEQSEPKRILVVEDDKKIARFLQIDLNHSGYSTEIELNGRRALDKIVQGNYDLILLDVMLPGMDGLTICERVRAVSDVPIIMLTAKDDISDRVQGLDIGADDYITKPFAMEELLARIRNVFRQREREPKIDEYNEDFKYVFRDIELSPARHEVKIKGERVELTKKEFSLIEYLMKNKSLVLSRDQILRDVWGYDYLGDTNVVDVYVRYLRTKIDERFGEHYITTIRGIGYSMREE